MSTDAADAKTQVVTPWKVEASEGGIDYDKLTDEFGCQKLTPELRARIEKATGAKCHHFLRRELFFAHRDIEFILKMKEEGKPFYIYTGRGPSSDALHLGHLVPFMFVKWLQDVFDVPVVIQLTDDEKFLFKSGLDLDEATRLGFENSKDIIAMGFDESKTLIFRNTDYIHYMYPTILRIQDKVTFNQVKGIFGFDGSSSIGRVAFPATQAAPSFPDIFPTLFGGQTDVGCLIPCAIDQDPYFRMTRDIAPRMNRHKPCLLLSKFIPSLQGFDTKMSASSETTSIYVTDSPKQIKDKINKKALSGGRDTAEEQAKYGANLAVDVPFHYLTYFLEDDEELDQIRRDYSSGKMMTGHVKKRLIEVVQEIIKRHQDRRASVDDDTVRRFMDPTRACLKQFS